MLEIQINPNKEACDHLRKLADDVQNSIQAFSDYIDSINRGEVGLMKQGESKPVKKNKK